MLFLTESELRESIRSVILERDRIKGYNRLAESIEDDVKKWIETNEEAIEELEQGLENPEADPKGFLDTVKKAHQVRKSLKSESYQRYGMIKESTELELIEEGGMLLATSIALAAPKVIELCVAGVAWCIGDEGPMKGKHKETMDKLESHLSDDEHHEHHDKYANKYLNMLDHFAHSIHEKYIGLISRVLKSTFGVKQKTAAGVEWLKFWKKKQEKQIEYDRLKAEEEEFAKKVDHIAEKTLLLIVAILAVVSGAGAVSALKSGHAGLAALETGLGGVKALEIAEGTNALATLGQKLVSNAPEIIKVLMKA